MKVFKISTAEQIQKSSKQLYNKVGKNQSMHPKTKSLLSVVSIPLVAYVLRNEKDAKANFVKNTLNDNYISPNEKTNMKIITELENNKIIESQKPWQPPRFDNGILTESGYNDVTTQINNSNLSDYDKQKYLNQLKRSNYKVNFGQSPQDIEHPEDLNIEEFKTVDLDIPDLGFAEFENLSIADIAEVLENPALQAFATEVLLGTRFLRPLRDLKRGDVKKAGIGTLTRTAEIALAPVKLGWVACGSLMGMAFKVCGIDEEWTGPIGGAKHFAQEWAKGRDGIENELIGRETKEPELTPKQAYTKYKEAKEMAIKYLREKIAARGEEYRAKLSKYFENSLLQYKAYNEYLENLIAQEEQRQEFYSNQIANIISTGMADREAILRDIEELKNKKALLQKTYNEQMHQLDEYLQNHLSDEKTVQRIEKTKQELLTIFETSNRAITEEIDRINNILNINKTFQQNKNLRGFGKIAGYDDIKDQLYKSFIRPAKLANSGEKQQLPNLILLYGPKGCGKTIFAKSLQEESNSNQIKLGLTMNSDKDFENLQKALKKASDDYKLTGKHTIIRIDEINGFLKDKNVSTLISNLANDYHCTIVGTTNKPNEINDSLLPSEGFESIYIEPANKRNIIKIMRYYLKNIAGIKFDYANASDILINNSNGNYSSNAKLEGFIKNYIKTEFLQSSKFDSEKFLGNLPNLKADIQAKEVQNFQKGIK